MIIKKNVFAMLMVTVLVISLAGCGGQVVEDVFADAKTTENIEETDKTESSEAVLPETSVSMREETVAEELEEEVSYVERDSFYQIEGASNDGTFYDVSTLERVSKTYTLEKSVDVYFLDTDLAGYTKTGISISVISSNDEWSYCIIDKVGLLLKTDELMEAIAKPVVAEATPSVPVAESPKPESAPVESIPVSEVPVAEQPIVEESDKYTPEEAIAVYRSIIEANGIIWDPSSKGNWDDTIGQYPIEEWYLHDRDYNGTSWGTGFIYLDKGYPEQAAQMELEGMAYGDGVGHSHTHYYFEVTGSDENCVYLVAWGY